MSFEKQVLVVDGEPRSRRVLAEVLARAGHGVSEAQDGRQAIDLCRRQCFSLVFAELTISRARGVDLLQEVRARCPQTPVVLFGADTDVNSAMDAMRHGAFDFLLKPLSAELVEAVAKRALGRVLQPSGNGNGAARPIITRDPHLLKLLELARSIAPSRARVLLSGESGTGKELFARFIHVESGRKGKPFVAVNCAALPESLLESELFGHEKGAFTGAMVRKAGKFELAHGGTLLLDEVSEMKPPLQAKLLRVLQEGEIDRVGGRSPVPIDVRIVATTNQDLEKMIEEGGFRQDLYYRLNVIPFKLPPLRERRQDLEPLVEHFLAKFRRPDGSHAGAVAPEAMQRLMAAPWKGNVRELENVIERAVLVSNNCQIRCEHLFMDGVAVLQADELSVMTACGPENFPLSTLREMERKMIRRSLEETGGNRTHAAKILGVSVRTLRNKLSEYRREQGERI
jgi:DNA-binding NtrC family response regulator